MVTKNDIFKMMKDFGIKSTDKVTVHSSLRSVGPIENGADGLIDAMKEYLSEGLLIIPTHTWRDIGTTKLYDVNNSVPCIGVMAEVAAFRKDGVRSLHPSHSVAVFGNGAAEFVKGEEKSTSPCPVGCCLGKLYDEYGKILLIGVGQERNTYLHTVDEILDIPNRINPVAIDVTIKDYDGNEILLKGYHSHGGSGIPGGVSTRYPLYQPALEYAGAVEEGKLGNAKVYCTDARKATDIVTRIWQRADYDVLAEDKRIPEEFYKN